MMMKAATQKTYGTPDVLRIVDVEAPTAGEGQILVRVHASPVTQGDRRVRAGDFPGAFGVLGFLMIGIGGPRKSVPGTMFAGRVVAVGPGVTRFSVGDDVFGSVDAGAHADLLVVDANGSVALMPEQLSYAEAAAIPYGAGTALEMLRDKGQLKSGERVLVLGASGGVGRFAVQIAKHLGAEVTGVCSERKAAMVRSLGADHVVDYRTTDPVEDSEAYDVIFDTIGAVTFGQARQALRPGGRYVTLIASGAVMRDMLRTSIFGDKKAITGVVMGSKQTTEDLRQLAEQGAIWSVIDGVSGLDGLVEAHRRVESGEALGAVVVAPSSADVVAKPTALDGAGGNRVALRGA